MLVETHGYTLYLGTNPDRLQKVHLAQVFGRSRTASSGRLVYKAFVLDQRPALPFRIVPWLSRLIPEGHSMLTTLAVKQLVVTQQQYANELGTIPVYVE